MATTVRWRVECNGKERKRNKRVCTRKCNSQEKQTIKSRKREVVVEVEERIWVERLIYLSGGISGKDREDYMSEFSYYEQRLTQERTVFDEHSEVMQSVGVINPAKVCDCLPKLQPHEYMRICGTLLGMCDMIYMLPNWENSKGAREELAVALSMGMTVEVAPTE